MSYIALSIRAPVESCCKQPRVDEAERERAIRLGAKRLEEFKRLSESGEL